MFSILLDVWTQLKALKPAFISKTPHFNFITVHYFYLMGMAILCSICLYPNGNMRYIDSLFLGSGASTQSGLNTIDINLLTTWQQIAIYLTTMVCNPIAIHSFVVFLRLYWFEKRFQHVAREAKKNRRSIAKTISKAKTNERDIGEEERGVNGRQITVMHETTRPNGMTNDKAVPEDFDTAAEKARALESERARSNSSGTSKAQSSDSGGPNDVLHISDTTPRPQIKFADQVKRSDGLMDEHLRMPVQRSTEEHIAILERQRKGEDDGAVLRIPGPRDADAGVSPQTVDENDPATRTLSRRASTHDDRTSGEVRRLNGDDHIDPPRRNITITEPVRSPTDETPTEHVAEDVSAFKHAFGVIKLRKPKVFSGKKLHEDNDGLHQTRSRLSTLRSIKTAFTSEKQEGMPYLSWEATVGRNSAFVDLTESQREELGGIEYRSLKALALILTCYFWGFMAFGVICLTPWILRSNKYGAVVDADGQSRTWWGIFTANSAFNDLGFTLTPDSMISFQAAQWPLVLMTFLIIIGNTGFPIMLRIIIWVTSQYVPKDSGIWEELKFLLDHPRRCFTLLFPAKATWWLFWILVILNGLDLVLFIVLDLGNTIVTQLPVNIRVLDGWFQAVSTRTAGFGVVNLSELHPAIQVSYLIMMYISVLPIAISVRRTNVYEEKSLGIYGSQVEEDGDEREPSYVGAHLRRQLSFDLWYIFLGVFIIAISEGHRIQSGDPGFTMFNVLFEIVSAYGTVGLSLGYPGINASFSAEFGTIAKLVIIAMQIRGRHRGLPYELDRAILLPSEHLQEKEAADASQRVRRRSSAATMHGLATVGSGAAKTIEKTTSRSTERQNQAQNFLSSMLHPGPMIPNSHRNIHKTDPFFEGGKRRRHSISVTGMGGDRSVSPGAGGPFGGFNSFFSSGGDNASSGERGRRMEGRRHFFQDGVNPHTPLSPTAMKEEGTKQD